MGTGSGGAKSAESLPLEKKAPEDDEPSSKLERLRLELEGQA